MSNDTSDTSHRKRHGTSVARPAVWTSGPPDAPTRPPSSAEANGNRRAQRSFLKAPAAKEAAALRSESAT